jgi:hypothetical protein
VGPPDYARSLHVYSTFFAGTLGAFDAQHVELALDVAEDEVGARHLALRREHLISPSRLR